MALDNPSYFTIPGGNTSSASNRTGRFSILRKHVRMGATTSSSPSTPSSASATNLLSSTSKHKKNERYSVLPTPSASPAPESTPLLPSAPDPSHRRSLRTLLRTTSFDHPLQTQMLVLGMPRPSDIAPSNHQFSPSGKKQHNRNASTGKVGGRTMGGNVEPLLPVDERYYNVLSDSNFIQTGRRHSIGAYFTRKGTGHSGVTRNEPQIQEETSFCDESDKIDWKLKRDTPPTKKKNCEELGRKKCGCCQTSQGGRSTMEDIIILSSARSQAADLWASYFRTCFDQIRKNRNKPPFRILSVGIEDTGGTESIVPDLQEKLRSAKLVIFILCPVFLEHIAQNPDSGSFVCCHVRPEGVLGMLLGIGESAVTEDHKAALHGYSQWRRMESVKDRDEKFVGDFLGAAMDIMSLNFSQQRGQQSEKGAFMLMPKKVNKSQNKVLVLLNQPITKEDEMRVTIHRNNELFDVPSVKKRNPYTLIFRMPEDFLSVSSLVSIHVQKNGQDLGSKLLKCESQLYALVQILKSCDSPIEFMCQALNIVPCDKDKLDDFLVSAFQRNIPPHFNLLQTSAFTQLRRGVTSKEEYPTLLHFAARHGLEKLCWLLLECPGGEVACDIRNSSDLTPAEMAEGSGHSKLGNALCGYMQMTEFTSVYTFLKGMSDDKNSCKSDTSDDYLNPRPLSETYQVPPSPRPLPHAGYIPMHSPKTAPHPPQDSDRFSLLPAPLSKASLASLASSKEKLLHRKASGEIIGHRRENSGNGIQDELIEIINDFKNNVFTISEVEKLVEEWKNRNDVQQSFREKQEQLNKMREEYERVQQRLKDEMKQVGRPSPMERIRNFFRSKSKEKSSEGQEAEKKRQEETSLLHRPSSGLSIQSSSSSSSGRLSTGSHCSGTSLGDSGTHSDAESERKVRSTPKCCSILKAKDALDNYDVPPNPVCLFGPRATPTNRIDGISDYDIPPPTADDSCPSCRSCRTCDSPSAEPNYYNLIAKDIPIPNHSTLHDRLSGGRGGKLGERKEREEGGGGGGGGKRREEIGGNCYEYINLPTGESIEQRNDEESDGRSDGQGKSVRTKSLVLDSDEGSGDESFCSDVRLPDYVNVETPKAVAKEE